MLVLLRSRLDDYDSVIYALPSGNSTTILHLQSIDDEASYISYNIRSSPGLANSSRSSLSTDETRLGVGGEGDFIHALVAAVVVNVVLHVENRV